MKTGIALFVYNRPEHTKEVLEGLKKNNIDKLYIFVDGPKKEEHLLAIQDVSNIVNSIDWCETDIIKNDMNKGLANSIVKGVNYVLDRHERIIVLEDDCVPGEDFVEFMEKCFDRYSDDDKVMNITGYSLPIELPQEYLFDTYFSYRASSWGWGTWRRAWKKFKRDPEILYEIYDDENFMNKVEFSGKDLIPMLEKQIKGEIDSWAIYWALTIIKNGGLCVEPVKSRIMNVGFDNSGVHCGFNNRFDVRLSSNNFKELNMVPVGEVDQRIARSYGEFYSRFVPNENERKLQLYYKMLNKWLSNIHNQLYISKYFKDNDIKSIAIYGCGEIGLRFFEELNNTDINVSCFVSQKGGESINSIQVLDINKVGEVKEIDYIVVTPIYDYLRIKKQINNINPYLNIISIESIVDYINTSVA